jgi:SulP family sulfate permease
VPNGTATANLLRPKLLSVVREGYSLESFRHDLLAGLTVSIVALPLSMAIAVASGTSPERGLYASIFGGAVVSALGGSRFQIGGPAGAFIVLVAATTARFGLDGLLLTVMLSGLLLALAGLLRVGSVIRHVPHAVAVGFTAAIAITIMASQLKDLGGLALHGPEPGSLLPKLQALAMALPSFKPAAFLTGAACAAAIFLFRSLRPAWPGMLITTIVISAVAHALRLPVETIGDRFGALAASLPAPRLPPAGWPELQSLAPAVFSFALLGGVESLLSARVADGMTGRVHRSNMELLAQGLANIVSALFGGIAVTGTIARTATNVRAGARTPVAGLLHALFLLLFLLVLAPLAQYLPLAVLAGILVTVCWNMAEKAEFIALLKKPRSAGVLLTTFAGTLVFDLTTGIVAGWLLSWASGAAAGLWARRAG